MESVGRVIKVSSDMVDILIIRNTACGKDCTKCAGCPDNNLIVKAKNTVNTAVGDRVKIRIVENSLLLITILVYVIPLITLITMYILVYELIINNELFSLLIALFITLFSFLLVRNVGERLEKAKKLDIKISEKL